MLQPRRATRYSVSVSRLSRRDLAPKVQCGVRIACNLPEMDDRIKEAE